MRRIIVHSNQGKLFEIEEVSSEFLLDYNHPYLVSNYGDEDYKDQFFLNKTELKQFLSHFCGDDYFIEVC